MFGEPLTRSRRPPTAAPATTGIAIATIVLRGSSIMTIVIPPPADPIATLTETAVRAGEEIGDEGEVAATAAEESRTGTEGTETSEENGSGTAEEAISIAIPGAIETTGTTETEEDGTEKIRTIEEAADGAEAERDTIPDQAILLPLDREVDPEEEGAAEIDEAATIAVAAAVATVTATEILETITGVTTVTTTTMTPNRTRILTSLPSVTAAGP